MTLLCDHTNPMTLMCLNYTDYYYFFYKRIARTTSNLFRSSVCFERENTHPFRVVSARVSGVKICQIKHHIRPLKKHLLNVRLCESVFAHILRNNCLTLVQKAVKFNRFHNIVKKCNVSSCPQRSTNVQKPPLR